MNGGLQSRPTLEGKVFSLTDTCAWLELLHAALDCYNWVFNQQLLSPSEVFPGERLSGLEYQSKHNYVYTRALNGVCLQ